ncbi:MAG: hypothetical protein FWE23_01820 [Chitinivibrionia bacterium]|nr:hypothetical protein [Chitinivibrionia bacterium]
MKKLGFLVFVATLLVANVFAQTTQTKSVGFHCEIVRAGVVQGLNQGHNRENNVVFTREGNNWTFTATCGCGAKVNSYFSNGSSDLNGNNVQVNCTNSWDLVNTIPATCDEAGVRNYVSTVGGHKRSVAIPRLTGVQCEPVAETATVRFFNGAEEAVYSQSVEVGHTIDWNSTTLAGSLNGYTTWNVLNCAEDVREIGATIERDYTGIINADLYLILAPAHVCTEGKKIIIEEAHCTEAGAYIVVCDCGDILREVVIPAPVRKLNLSVVQRTISSWQDGNNDRASINITVNVDGRAVNHGSQRVNRQNGGEQLVFSNKDYEVWAIFNGTRVVNLAVNQVCEEAPKGGETTNNDKNTVSNKGNGNDDYCGDKKGPEGVAPGNNDGNGVLREGGNNNGTAAATVQATGPTRAGNNAIIVVNTAKTTPVVITILNASGSVVATLNGNTNSPITWRIPSNTRAGTYTINTNVGVRGTIGVSANQNN